MHTLTPTFLLRSHLHHALPTNLPHQRKRSGEIAREIHQSVEHPIQGIEDFIVIESKLVGCSRRVPRRHGWGQALVHDGDRGAFDCGVRVGGILEGS